MMWLFIGGMATGVILTLVVIVFLANVTGEGVDDFPPDPTYHPAGWKEWHEARQGGRES